MTEAPGRRKDNAANRDAKRYVNFAISAVIEASIVVFPSLSRSERPSNAINFGGGGDYVEMGDGLVGSIIEFTGACEGQTLVDIGCGIGRNATALHRRFGESIEYRGFDIVRHGVTWCKKHFARVSDRYKFERADIYNSAYNPFGRLQASEFTFPYADGSADIAFATSVFTHMQPSGVQRYICEASRVLKTGGLVYFTFFILDEDSEARIREGKASFSFAHQSGACRIEDMAQPDGVVAYRLEWVEAALAQAGFGELRLERCSWRDGHGSATPSFQDIVVAKKRG